MFSYAWARARRGDAYGQALADGYGKDKARTYSVLIGASEALLENLLAGVGAKVGITDEILLKKIRHIGKGIGRVALSGAVRIGSEEIEENLQNYLDPLFREILFGEEYQAPSAQETIETTVVTALTTLLLGGGDIARDIAGVRQDARSGKADRAQSAADGALQALPPRREAAEALQRQDELALRRWEEHTRAQALDQMVENLQNGRMPSGLPVEGQSAGMKNAARQGGGVRYSLRAFEDGLRFVDVQTDQEQFDGLSDTEKTKLAVQIIKKKFAGRVVGVDNRVFINGGSAAEYGHPAKNIDSDIRDAKMRASTELDNLIDAGTNFRTEPDGRDGHVHPEATGDFQYFDTIFKVGTEYYTGVINIEQTARGLKLKDITKIRNITQDISSSYGKTPKSTFLRDASMGGIFRNSQKVNGYFSQNQVESTQTAVRSEPLQPGLVKDRLYRRANLTSRQQKTLDAIGRALGVEVRFAEQVDGGRANGSYAGGVITIALNSADPVGTVFAHEVVYRVREASEESYRRLERFVGENMSGRAMAAALAERGERYGSEDTGYLTEETVADAVGYLLGDTESLARLVQADLDLSRTLLDVVHDVVQKIRQTLRRDGSAALTERQRESFRDLESRLDELEQTLREAIGTAEAESTAAGNGEAKYALDGKTFREDKYFARLMDRWNSLTDGSHVKVGAIQKGSALERIGLPAGPMYFDVGKIRKAMADHGDHLSSAVLKDIPDLLNDPIVIAEYKGAKNTVNVYGNLFVNGTPVVVGVVMRLDSSGKGTITNIRTIHVRRDFSKQITDDSVLYLNEDKKKTQKWFHDCGNLNVPLAGTQFGVIRSITFDADSVKRENPGLEKIS